MWKLLGVAVLSISIGSIAGYFLGYESKELEIAMQNKVHANPAYMIVLGEVFDRPAFMEGYAEKLPPLYEQFGGHYVAIGGGPGIEVLEGDYAPPSYVLSKWPNAQAARDFWSSEGYDELRRARIDNAWGEFDVLLIQGLPGTPAVPRE
ncbi:MAG: DUF1330 domain-containing protein [Pseudomonadota bacterium]